MRDGSPVTLYCFAHAGAGVTSFAHWHERTGPGVRTVPVLLPGREVRRREPRPTGRAELLGALLGPLAEEVSDGRPYALYGHSLGGMVAYTLVRALIDAGLPAPVLLAVGASPAPHTVPVRRGAGGITDEQLLRFVADLGSAPAGVLADPGSVWHRAVLPVLRDDLELAAALRAAALDPALGGPLPVPVLAVGGRDDPVVGPAALDGWARWTTGHLARRTVPGDHFFVRGPEIPRLVGRACRTARRIELIPGGQQ